MRSASLIVALCFTVLAATRPAAATTQPMVPAGPELQVNSYTTGVQFQAAVAMDADGDFVVTWESYGQDGAGYGVFAQRWSSSGAKVGGEFQVATYTIYYQRSADVALAPGGGFVVVWTTPQTGISARRFTSAGVAQGAELQVNAHTPAGQYDPSVTMDGAGGFVVAWQGSQDGSSYGIFARRFNSAGLPQSLDFQVTVTTVGAQQRPTLAGTGGGRFVIAWESAGQDGSSSGIFARRFDSAGNALGGELAVNEFTAGDQTRPSVGVGDDGAFTLAWESLNQDGSNRGVFARRFDSTGVPQATELQVNLFTVNHQQVPVVAMHGDGRFVVAWQSQYQDGNSSGVFGRRFDSLGTPQPSEFRANFSTSSSESTPAIAIDANGDFVVAWQSFAKDGSNIGVFAQRFVTFAAESDFQVNAYTLSSQREPAVAMADGGAFAVVWRNGVEIHGRRFDPAVDALGGDFRIDGHTTMTASSPTVAMEPDGDFVVAWAAAITATNQTAVQARRFDSTGGPQGAEIQVHTSDYLIPVVGINSPSVAVDDDGDFVVTWEDDTSTFDANHQVQARRVDASGSLQGFVSLGAQGEDPAAAMDGNGGFVVVWEDLTGAGDFDGLVARRFNSAGAQQGAEFVVHSYTTSQQFMPKVAMNAGGAFVVTWTSFHQDGSFGGVFARPFSSSGAALGPELQVNVRTAGGQGAAVAGIDDARNVLIAWVETSPDVVDGPSVFGRLWNADGLAGDVFQVNTYTLGYQYPTAVAMNGGGDFVIVWEDPARDGGGYGIFARRFARSAQLAITLDVDDNGEAEPLTDGLLILRYVFGFRDATLTLGAVGAGAQRASASEIEAYIASIVSLLDVDANGEVSPLTDGLLILRYLFGFLDASLVAGAIGPGATRNTAPEIEAYLAAMV